MMGLWLPKSSGTDASQMPSAGGTTPGPSKTAGVRAPGSASNASIAARFFLQRAQCQATGGFSATGGSGSNKRWISVC